MERVAKAQVNWSGDQLHSAARGDVQPAVVEDNRAPGAGAVSLNPAAQPYRAASVVVVNESANLGVVATTVATAQPGDDANVNSVGSSKLAEPGVKPKAVGFDYVDPTGIRRVVYHPRVVQRLKDNAGILDVLQRNNRVDPLRGKDKRRSEQYEAAQRAFKPPPSKAFGLQDDNLMRDTLMVRSGQSRIKIAAPADMYMARVSEIPIARVASVQCVSSLGDVVMHSWGDGDVSVTTSKAFIFIGELLGVPVRMMYDTGAEANFINESLQRRLGMSTVASALHIKFGNGTTGTVTRRTTPQLIKIQGHGCYEAFFTVPDDMPGVDIVLGQSFAARAGASIIYPPAGDNSVPYLRFRDGKVWHTEDVVAEHVVGLHDDTESAMFRTINAEQMKQFTKKHGRTMTIMVLRVMVNDEGNVAAVNQDGQVLGGEDMPQGMQDLIKEFQGKVFATELPTDLPTQRQDQPNSVHHIDLIPGAKPVKVRPIPLSYGEQLILMELLQEMLAKGYLSPAPRGTLWSAPVILLKKGNADRPGPITNRYRIVTDYRALNALTVPSVYVPPCVRDVLDALVHKRLFSKSDNLSGFYQAALAEEDRIKTTFTAFTPDGPRSYYFNVACLGLQGTPSTYQLFMEQCIDGIPGVWCYLDDLVYASNTLEEHLVLIRQVFERLAANQIYLNALKCVWCKSSLDFLGMHIAHNHVTMSAEKVQGLRDYPVPKSQAEVRRFVGFATYLSHFVPNFSAEMDVLTDMLKAGVKKKFAWTGEAQLHFDSIRAKLIASAGLILPDLRGVFVLETDASADGMGAVLYQLVQERLMPVWYLSRKLNSAERNYNTRDREMLAVIFALKKCRQYLAMRPFVLYSDHESLANFKVQPGLTGRDWRFQEYLAQFQIEQRYRKGEDMTVPDALSRAFDARVQTASVWADVEHELFPTFQAVPTKPDPMAWVDGQGVDRALTAEAMAAMARVDREFKGGVTPKITEDPEGATLMNDLARTELRRMIAAMNFTRPAMPPDQGSVDVPSVVVGGMKGGAPAVATVMPAVVAAVVPPAPGVVEFRAGALAAYNATVAGQVSSTTVESAWHDDVRTAYELDAVYGPLLALCVRRVQVLDNVEGAVALTLQESSRVKKYSTSDGMLYFNDNGEQGPRLCVPVSAGNSLRLLKLYEAHETGVHGGATSTFARLARCFLWPGMRADVKRYVASCKSCRLNKARSVVERGALSGLEIPAARWQTVQADWITGLPVTAGGFNTILVVEDRLTKYAYFIPAKSTDDAAMSAQRAFAVAFCVHGVPETLVSDRDSKFTSAFFGSLMALMHVKQAMGTSYYHDFNGAVECLNKTVEVMLRHLVMEFPQRDFDDLLPMAQWAYNTAQHSAINMSPYRAMFGTEPRQPMEFALAGQRVPPPTAFFAELQQQILVSARDAVLKAQETMLQFENRARRDVTFTVGEHVFLNTVNLGGSHFSTTVQKLRQRYCGPYRVVAVVSAYTYQLELPHSMKALHPVFHASLLWKAVPTPDDMKGRLGPGVDFPPPVGPFPKEGPGELTQDDDGEPVYVIESVVARERRSGRRGLQYLVKWVGYTAESNTWISKDDAVTEGALRLLQEFDTVVKKQQQDESTVTASEQDSSEQQSVGDSALTAKPAKRPVGRPRKQQPSSATE